jgi:prepilin-type N-terminal cleavage/methylation domain-containing protein
MRKNNRKGFTIVELVIVIAVIAILAGVLIPTFSGIVKKAQYSAAQQAATNAYKEAYALALAGDGIIYTPASGEGTPAKNEETITDVEGWVFTFKDTATGVEVNVDSCPDKYTKYSFTWDDGNITVSDGSTPATTETPAAGGEGEGQG